MVATWYLRRIAFSQSACISDLKAYKPGFHIDGSVAAASLTLCWDSSRTTIWKPAGMPERGADGRKRPLAFHLGDQWKQSALFEMQ